MAVREMLHVANVFYDALQLVRRDGAPRGAHIESSPQYTFTGHVKYLLCHNSFTVPSHLIHIRSPSFRIVLIIKNITSLKSESDTI